MLFLNKEICLAIICPRSAFRSGIVNRSLIETVVLELTAHSPPNTVKCVGSIFTRDVVFDLDKAMVKGANHGKISNRCAAGAALLTEWISYPEWVVNGVGKWIGFG
jgi:hypothetical protein